ncbi:MAG: DUF721 domain-containing protein [Patescibacteria group bacterium]
MFKDVKSILPNSLKRAGISKRIKEEQVVKCFNQIKNEILPENLANKVRAMYISEGILTIASLSTLATQELYFNKDKIILAINNKLGHEVVMRLKYIA